MEGKRNTGESLPRNLKSHKEETIIALVAVEGDAWKLQQEGWSDNNIAGALSWLSDAEKDLPTYIIFGRSGVNRWIVDIEGNVSLLRSSSTDYYVGIATREGFKIV